MIGFIPTQTSGTHQRRQPRVVEADDLELIRHRHLLVLRRLENAQRDLVVGRQDAPALGRARGRAQMLDRPGVSPLDRVLPEGDLVQRWKPLPK